MTPNAPLLRATLAHIESHLPDWDQGCWTPADECGSAMCFAGHAAVTLAGGVILSEGLLKAESGDDPEEVEPMSFGDAVSVEARARRLLGLSRRQACALFSEGNTLDDLRHEVRLLCEEEA